MCFRKISKNIFKYKKRYNVINWNTIFVFVFFFLLGTVYSRDGSTQVFLFFFYFGNRSGLWWNYNQLIYCNYRNIYKNVKEYIYTIRTSSSNHSFLMQFFVCPFLSIVLDRSIKNPFSLFWARSYLLLTRTCQLQPRRRINAVRCLFNKMADVACPGAYSNHLQTIWSKRNTRIKIYDWTRGSNTWFTPKYMIP